MQQRSVPSIDGFAGGGEAERGEAALFCSLRASPGPGTTLNS
jgi:hypothetical protein